MIAQDCSAKALTSAKRKSPIVYKNSVEEGKEDSNSIFPFVAGDEFSFEYDEETTDSGSWSHTLGDDDPLVTALVANGGNISYFLRSTWVILVVLAGWQRCAGARKRPNYPWAVALAILGGTLRACRLFLCSISRDTRVQIYGVHSCQTGIHQRLTLGSQNG